MILACRLRSSDFLSFAIVSPPRGAYFTRCGGRGPVPCGPAARRGRARSGAGEERGFRGGSVGALNGSNATSAEADRSDGFGGRSHHGRPQAAASQGIFSAIAMRITALVEEAGLAAVLEDLLQPEAWVP